jgi:hypothetical protein
MRDDFQKFHLKQMMNNSKNNSKQKKVEEDINGIYDRINSKFRTSATEDNLNYERENNYNDNNIIEQIKLEQLSLSTDIKNSFHSNYGSNKSTIVEKSVNFDSIINVEIDNNLNANLKENEICHNSNINNNDNVTSDLNQKVNLNHKKDKENNINNNSINKNDASNNIIFFKEKDILNKNPLHLINKLNDDKKQQINLKKINIKEYVKNFFSLKNICILIIVIIIIFLFIFQMYILIDYL